MPTYPKTYQQLIKLFFHDRTPIPLSIHASIFTLTPSIACYLTFRISPEQYQQIDRPTLLNLQDCPLKIRTSPTKATI